VYFYNQVSTNEDILYFNIAENALWRLLWTGLW